MKSNKSINLIISLVIYPYDIMISIGESDVEFLNSIKNYGVKKNTVVDLLNLPDSLKGRTVMILESNHTFMRLKSIPKTPLDYNFLQHEIFHSVDFILRKIGITLSTDSDEAYAYLIGYVTEKIYEKLL